MLELVKWINGKNLDDLIRRERDIYRVGRVPPKQERAL